MSYVDFISLDHENDVRLFVNFIERRGLSLVAISHGSPTSFCVWLRGRDADSMAQHTREFFQFRDAQRK